MAYSLNDQLSFVKDNNLRETVIQYITDTLHMTNIPHMHVLSNIKNLYEAAFFSNKRLKRSWKHNITDSPKYVNLYNKVVADAKEAIIYQLDTHYLPKDDKKVEESFKRHAAELDRVAAMSRAEAEDKVEFTAALHMRPLIRCLNSLYFDLDNDLPDKINSYFEEINFHLTRMNQHCPIITGYREVCFIICYRYVIINSKVRDMTVFYLQIYCLTVRPFKIYFVCR
jgi:hypothetical protein